jgi:hypothetical protein
VSKRPKTNFVLSNFEIIMNQTKHVLSIAEVQDLLKSFSKLDYAQKITWFDERFTVIPFVFPESDIEASWYNNEIKHNQLIEAFTKDSRGLNHFERKLCFGSREFKFDIRPVTLNQRILLNQYILNKFLATGNKTSQNLSDKTGKLSNPEDWLDTEIDRCQAIVNWTKHTIDKGNSAIRSKFLRIFYNGYQAYLFGNDKMVRVRRKFVELFLYSQGLLLAEYLGELQKEFGNIKKDEVTGRNLTLAQKVLLLERLGVINQLRKKLRRRKNNVSDNQLAGLLCLIISEPLQNQDSILKFFSSLGNGTNADVLTEANDQIIKQVLRKYKL